jgi:hypothetical protein
VEPGYSGVTGRSHSFSRLSSLEAIYYLFVLEAYINPFATIDAFNTRCSKLSRPKKPNFVDVEHLTVPSLLNANCSLHYT